MNIILAVKHYQLAIAQAKQVAEIVKETDTDFEKPSRATAAGDSRKLRGIPVLARSVGGTVPGTNPLIELLRKEEKRERTLLP